MAFPRKSLLSTIPATLKAWAQATFSGIGHSHVGIFDSRPDFDNAIDIGIADANTASATNIFQVIGDGWLHWQGCTGDQDVQIFASPTIEALSENLIPMQHDRFAIAAGSGEGTNTSAGMVYLTGTHTWFIYAMGNDKTHWKLNFIPSKSNTEANPIRIITTNLDSLYGFSAYGSVKSKIHSKDGYRIDFTRFWEANVNAPSMPSGLFHTHTLSKNFAQSYMLTGYTTLTFTAAGGGTKRIHRYWFCAQAAYVDTYNKYNERQLTATETLATPVYGNDLFILENVDNKWRMVQCYNWLDRAYSSDGSYTYRGNTSVASKVCVTEYRAITTADVGKWVRHSDTVMWHLDNVVTGTNANSVKITYTPYTFSGSATVNRTMTPGSQVVTDNYTTISYIYEYDAENNPHPYTYEFPTRWAFQYKNSTIGANTYRYYGWGFKYTFTAISPVVTWDQTFNDIFNVNHVSAPSNFTENLNFSGDWTCYRNPFNGDTRDYLSDLGFALNTTTGFRDRVVQSADLAMDIFTQPVTWAWGTHPVSNAVIPGGSDDTGGDTPAE